MNLNNHLKISTYYVGADAQLRGLESSLAITRQIGISEAGSIVPSGTTPSSHESLDRFMNVANGRVRGSHNFRDDIIGHVNSAGLCWVGPDRFNVQRRAHQSTVAQGDLSDAVTDAGNLRFGTPPDLK